MLPIEVHGIELVKEIAVEEARGAKGAIKDAVSVRNSSVIEFVLERRPGLDLQGAHRLTLAVPHALDDLVVDRLHRGGREVVREARPGDAEARDRGGPLLDDEGLDRASHSERAPLFEMELDGLGCVVEQVADTERVRSVGEKLGDHRHRHWSLEGSGE